MLAIDRNSSLFRLVHHHGFKIRILPDSFHRRNRFVYRKKKLSTFFPYFNLYYRSSFVLTQTEKMNNKIATGIWLVFAGVVFLLDNFNLIDFNFASVFALWPLLLVSMGLNLLLQNRPNGRLIVIICNILLCAFVFYRGITSQNYRNFTSWTNPTPKDTSENYNEHVSAAWEEHIHSATLTLSGGASKFSFQTNHDSTQLLAAHTTASAGALRLTSKGDQKVQLGLTSAKPNRGSNVPIEISLNKRPLWNFAFNVGASSITGDFRDLEIGKIEVNSGASSMELHLPAPTNGTSQIEINTAASKIKLYIPKEAECRVETGTIVSNNKFEGLEVVDGNERQSKGFEAATNRYDIEVSGAANSVSILRY